MKLKSLITAAALITAMVCSGGAAAQNKQVTVRVGWNPFAGSTPMTAVMINEKLFEQEAKKFGYDVTVEWIQLIAGAPPANAAFVAGRLDIDIDFASAAMVPRIKQKVPIVIFGVHASHLSNAVVVRPGSDINEIAKLAGKTIGVPIGTSAHYTLASIVKIHTGKTLQELGVKLVNMTPNEGIKMPQGLDAAGVWVPLRYMGKPLGTAELLADSSGYAGPAHKNGGKRFDDVKESWAYPEGYLVDRLYLCAREAFAKEHPTLLTAFLRARIRAQQMATADVDKALATANEFWKLDPAVAAQARDTYPENTNIRNAPYILEYDALAIIKTSEFFLSLGTIDDPVTWAELTPILLAGADLQKKAWEEGGSKPAIAEMEQHFKGANPTWPDLNIAGGKPIWTLGETPKWGERHYKPGPFEAKK
jgi:ABC-type nitrate/sulfonate/bicarbonate transport system substrate-binding protein